MQGPDIVMTTPEKAKLFELPYRFEGLTVQGASPTRLTPYPNPNVYVAPETIKAIGLRSLVRLFTEGKTAIARVGLGLRPAARTVSGHVQAAIFFAGLAQRVVNSPEPPLLTPTAAPLSNDGVDSAGYDASEPATLEVELEPEVEL